MPGRQLITSERIELDAASQAAIDAIEASRAEPIEKEWRLDDPRLERHRGLIQSSRTIITTVDDVMPALEEFTVRVRASPMQREIHPLAQRLKEKQEAVGVSLQDLIRNALGYEQDGRHVPAHMALISACRIYEVSAPVTVVEPKMPEPKTQPPAPEPTALERAIAAIKASPEKSVREIADEIGVSRQTVMRARQQRENVAGDVTVNVTVGRDGRSYRRAKAAQPEGSSALDALFPPGSPACDEDFEAHDPDGGSFQHRRAFQWQVLEAERLAVESALLREGAKVNKGDLKKARSVARHWAELAKKLETKRKR
jgi:hypothetical protein